MQDVGSERHEGGGRPPPPARGITQPERPAKSAPKLQDGRPYPLISGRRWRRKE